MAATPTTQRPSIQHERTETFQPGKTTRKGGHHFTAFTAAFCRSAWHRARRILQRPGWNARPASPASDATEPAATADHRHLHAVAPSGTVTRLACCGDLSPQTTVADFLNCAINWAERFNELGIHITWIGDGDLRGVLAAQPLPDNMAQQFLGRVLPMALADMVPAIDLIFVPDRLPGASSWVTAALAADIPVIGSAQSDAVRRSVLNGQNGWIFDAAHPASLMAALTLGIAGATDMRARLRAMREAALPRDPTRPPVGEPDRQGALPGGAASAVA